MNIPTCVEECSPGRMLDKYVFGADAVLLVYDVTAADTFERLSGWLEVLLTTHPYTTSAGHITTAQVCRAALAAQEKAPTFALVTVTVTLTTIVRELDK